MTTTTNTQNLNAVASTTGDDQSYTEATGSVVDNSSSVLSGGIAVLYLFMDILSSQSESVFKEMEANSNRSRESQNVANMVDQKIMEAQLEDPIKGKANIDGQIANYFGIGAGRNIRINGDSAETYLSVNADDDGNYTIGELQSIKAALEADSNQASDYVSQSQLQIQKQMQTYNVTVSLINSMQTLLADMNKQIAQNIR